MCLDGAGGARALTAAEVSRWAPEDGVLWLHLDYSSPEAVDWINHDARLESVSRAFLVAEDTRPRITSINNALLLALRGVNLNPHSDPEDMIGVRIWANESVIITTIRRTLLSISDISSSLEMGKGPGVPRNLLLSSPVD